MNKKMMNCKACGKAIAKSAKCCPECGAKNKKPIFKKWWFWVILVLVLLISMPGGEDQTDDSAGQNATVQHSDNAPTSAKLEKKEAYYVGDALMDGTTKIVFMSSGEYRESNDYSAPQQGNKYIYLQFAFENTSNSEDASVSFYDFECYADGYAAQMYFGGEEDLSATLSAGRMTTGYIYFEIPKDAQVVEVEYTINVFTEEKAKFIYEGEKTSSYEMPIDKTATAGAYKVGETAESSQLVINYLACEEYVSTNEFIQPRTGCHFVVCTFEFENVGSSDEFVSSWDFDCYADGVNCEQTFVREDDLGATISAGRKTKGTVVFEVPVEAEVVEVEYLSNYWTSNRVVFTVQ